MSYKDTISELLEQQNKIMEKLAIPLNEGETSKGHENDITRFMDFYFSLVDTTLDILMSYKDVMPQIEKIQNHNDKIEAMKYLLSKYDSIFEKLKYSNKEEASEQIKSLNSVANVVRYRILIEKLENSINEEEISNGKSR